MFRNLLLVGGDKRALHLAKLLREDGYLVDGIGLSRGDERTARIEEADALLFPYPFSVREDCVPCLSGLTLHPRDVLSRAKPGAVLLAGRGLEADGPFVLKRYMSCDALEERNADISAEASVHEAMGRMDTALMDATVLVTGYGRFGRALARRLRALGARVWVAARREEARLLAASDGMRAVSLLDLHEVLPKVDMVLSTVPARVLGEAELRAMRPGTWLLELASAPYGFDRDLAGALGLHAEVLPGLPARYAPRSAALALRHAVIRLLLEV